MIVTSPRDQSVLSEIPNDSAENIESKFAALKEGFKSWKSLPIDEKIDIIDRFGQIVAERRKELATLLTQETGKPISQSLGEIKGAHGRIKFITSQAKKFLSPEVVYDQENMREEIHYEPLGVIANISAWNYPYNVGYNVFLFALVSGNTVIYKPSEYAALTGLEIQNCLHQAGVPENVFQCVIGGAEAGKAILDLPCDGYFFTGSYKTGKYIAEQVAHKLVPVGLELGGKDPLYVAEDVKDIKNAAKQAVDGVYYNNGQSCCSIERIYVHEEVYNDFVDEFQKAVSELKVGDPMQEDTYIGPLTRKEQVKYLTDQVKDAQQKGATLLCGGQATGATFQPTVLLNVNSSMKVMRQESFGPIIGIEKVVSDQEALEKMQDTDYGLTAAVFTNSEEKAQFFMEALHTGTVYWNCCDRVSPYVPWSGRKNSGLGSTLSHIGVRAFTAPKAYQIRKQKI